MKISKSSRMKVSARTEGICALIVLILIYQNIPTGWFIGFTTGVVAAVASVSACAIVLVARNWNYDTMRSVVIMAGDFLRGQEKAPSFDIPNFIMALSPLLTTIFSKVKGGGSTIPPPPPPQEVVHSQQTSPRKVVRSQQPPPEVEGDDTKKVAEIENESDDESEQKITDVTTPE